MDTVPQDQLPSSRTLFRSTLIAAGTAAVILVTIVMPAEYGVDPTGIGSVIGLTQMGEIKMSLAEEAAAAEAAEAAGLDVLASDPAAVGTVMDSAAAADTASAAAAEVTVITLEPNEGKEIKLAMQEGATVRYEWSVEGGVVNYDTHGDPVDAPAGFYHGYGKGIGVPSDEGVLVAAFDGLHGWFWRNRTGAVVTVTLRTEGDYQDLRHMY